MYYNAWIYLNATSSGALTCTYNCENITTVKIVDISFPLHFFFYCCSITVVCIFSTPFYPTPAKSTSLPRLHPPPWCCPCVLYSSCRKPLSLLSPPHSPLAVVRLSLLLLWKGAVVLLCRGLFSAFCPQAC